MENSVDDLRVLFDLVLPGFSGELSDQTALAGFALTEDDPETDKQFSREELIELLSGV